MSQPLFAIRSSQPSRDGAGVAIQRVHGFHHGDMDPFLMLDEIRSDDPDEYIGGFPPHPHRGIETLTYMKVGGFRHEDHLGHQGTVSAGGAQWMSAGGGVIHSEMPLADNGLLHGFQLWVNLPAKDKFKPAEYRDIDSAQIPELSNDSSRLRLIAGRWQSSLGQDHGPLQLPARAAVADLMLQPNASIELHLDDSERLLVYLYQGSLQLPQATRQGYLLFINNQTQIRLQAGEQGLGALLLKGQPLNEPVAHWGPFVMNSQEQIQQAIDDYHRGRLVTAPESHSP